jgi:uncharacterized Zn-finger protein
VVTTPKKTDVPETSQAHPAPAKPMGPDGSRWFHYCVKLYYERVQAGAGVVHGLVELQSEGDGVVKCPSCGKTFQVNPWNSYIEK